jgi:hypothetical protein
VSNLTGQSVLAHTRRPRDRRGDYAKGQFTKAVESLQQIIKDRGLPPLLPAQLTQEKATLERCVREHYLTQAFVNSLLAEYEATIRERSNPPHRPGM